MRDRNLERAEDLWKFNESQTDRKKRWVDTTGMLQRPVIPILKPVQLLMHVTHEDTVVPEASPACKFERGKGEIAI